MGRTLAAQGKSAHSRVQLEAAVPTVTHMAIKALVDVTQSGYVMALAVLCGAGGGVGGDGAELG